VATLRLMIIQVDLNTHIRLSLSRDAKRIRRRQRDRGVACTTRAFRPSDPRWHCDSIRHPVFTVFVGV